jgi:RimJ/RimL family protein N-acetyltransferase
MLFAWRNDPFVVARSGSQRQVSWTDHEVWFPRVLGSPACLALIAEFEGTPIGHVRFDPVGASEVAITIYLIQAFTGRGLGVECIRAGCDQAWTRWPHSKIVAHVRAENSAAQSAFRKAGFTSGGDSRSSLMTLINHPSCLAQEEQHTSALYNRLLDRHGHSHSALNWGSKEGQQRRFEVLAAVGDLSSTRLLDVGCGLADFADWLDERRICVDYTGLDLTPALAETAARRRPDLRLVQGSILDDQVLQDERFDYVVASGVFYTYINGGEENLRRIVTRMWSLAEQAIAFNALSAWAPDRKDDEYYANPLTVLDFCRSFSPCVVLRHDYHPRDFTIYVTRDRRTP